ncbi:HAD family hydrolase [Micromonospora lupini]|uniref:HAD-superfamily hydrolase subfamily IA n=1 Tax=Micromonospora lupini str. Lupac 08 TaxID=1150864 RepID=I0KW06_9ACTN|nr:HAD family phosphatase [Micromonospora lupini]CCH15753.1 HAD-superfamily hydrolase subfamily IA [Micromonospora lupini str. Lupac 08]
MRAVWTDFAGVLTPPVGETVRSFCAAQGIEPDQYLGAMKVVGDRYGGDTMAPLDTPLITQDEWATQMEEVLAERYGVSADLSDFGAKWFADRRSNTEWVDWLRTLRRQGTFVGLVSNMVPAWDVHWRAMLPVAELFDDVVLSFEVGARKPEPAIFALAATRAGVPPRDCVLVDDLAKNCAGAQAAGWHAVHFTSTGEAVAELEPWIRR